MVEKRLSILEGKVQTSRPSPEAEASAQWLAQRDALPDAAWVGILTLTREPETRQEKTARSLAGTRGWSQTFFNGWSWHFSGWWQEEGLIHLLRITPAQFKSLPEATRCSLLQEAKERVHQKAKELRESGFSMNAPDPAHFYREMYALKLVTLLPTPLPFELHETMGVPLDLNLKDAWAKKDR